MSKKPPSEWLRRLELSPQFIQPPSGGGRLVVLPKAQSPTLERMAVEHLKPNGVESEQHHLPDEIRLRIAAGESPVRVAALASAMAAGGEGAWIRVGRELT